MDAGHKYLSIAKSSSRYGISKSRIYEHLASGDIVGVKYGVKTLIDVESADRFFAALPRVQIKPRSRAKAGA